MKRAIAFALLTCGACRPTTTATTTTSEPDCASRAHVMLVSAIRRELDAVLDAGHDFATFDRNAWRYGCGSFGGHDVVTVLTGVGPDHARYATEKALAGFPNVDDVIVVGTAGAVSDSLHIGDVAIPAQWIRHDVDGAHFVAADPTLFASATHATASLATCDDASVCAAAPGIVAAGNGATGARFVDDPALAKQLHDKLGAVVVEMETATVAEVAAQHHVHFIALRAVSDVVGSGRSDELFDRYVGLASHNAAQAALGVVRLLP